MNKKIIEIFICMLFLFSTYPIVMGVNNDKNIEEPTIKGNNPNNYIGFYGTIMWGVIKLVDENPSSYWIIPIHIRVREFHWEFGLGFYNNAHTIISDHLLGIPKDSYKYGFINNFTLFTWDFHWIEPY